MVRGEGESMEWKVRSFSDTVNAGANIYVKRDSPFTASILDRRIDVPVTGPPDPKPFAVRVKLKRLKFNNE